jgi:hydrogenase-4 component E
LTTGGGYPSVLDLAVGALLLMAVLIVWRREFTALIRLLALQGVALGAIPIAVGVHNHDATLVAVGVAVVVLRAVVLPWLVARLTHGDQTARESNPLVNTIASLLAVAALVTFAYAVSRPLTRLDPTTATNAVPAAFAVVLIGLFVLITRRRALSQIVGFLVLDNGIAAMAFLLTAGVPLIVELGASLDVLLVVLVLQVLGGRMRIKFGGTDLGELRELRDR